MKNQELTPPTLTDRATWLEKRVALLDLEKKFSRSRDQISAARRALPWVRVETDYLFASPNGDVSLTDLFGQHRQLVIYHFMFGSDWEEGCKSCSYFADSFDKAVEHLAARDTAFRCVSNAEFDQIDAYRQRLGWSFGWVSAAGSTFGEDYGVTFPDGSNGDGVYNYGVKPGIKELPGLSVFCRLADGGVAHTYSTYSRGLDLLNVTYNILDHTPLGRDEGELDYTMSWVERRDQY